VPQIQEFWNKLNPRERLTVWGALAVAVGWIIGLTASYGIGGGGLSLIGAIAVVVVLYLKYAPNQTITWPAPVPTIILVISAVVAIGALLTLLDMLRFLSLVGYGFVAGAILAGVVTAAGAVLMVWGAWQEYQLTAPAGSPGAPGSATPPPAPPAWTPPPPAPPAAPTMPPPAASDTDEPPPA
jgi:hypothetical protein